MSNLKEEPICPCVEKSTDNCEDCQDLPRGTFKYWEKLGENSKVQDIFELKEEEIVYDIRARDGTWCKLPYLNHILGCPNYPVCIEKHSDFKIIADKVNVKWYAVVEEFDLQAHTKIMKEKHPNWTEKQCRNLLYWQGSVRKRLKEKTYKYIKKLAVDKETNFSFAWATIILEIPEAHGINVFATMEKVGVILDKNPQIVRKVMIIGIPNNILKNINKQKEDI